MTESYRRTSRLQETCEKLILSRKVFPVRYEIRRSTLISRTNLVRVFTWPRSSTERQSKWQFWILATVFNTLSRRLSLHIAREQTVFRPAHLLRNWCEQRPINRSALDRSITREDGGFCYAGMELLRISFLFNITFWGLSPVQVSPILHRFFIESLIIKPLKEVATTFSLVRLRRKNYLYFHIKQGKTVT